MNASIHMNNGPWGNRPKGPSSVPPPPPDMDRVIRGAQDRFKNSFGKGGGGMPSAGGIGAGLLALVLLWLGSGFYRVQPSEHAVVLTFGKWTDTKVMPGLSWHIPAPVQDVIKVDVALDRRITVGFVGTAPGSRGSGSTGDVPMESLMLTGDENIIDIDFVVLWRVADAGKFLFNIRDPEMTLKRVAESAMREIVGRTEIQKALTEGRGEVEIKTKELMQKILDEYQSGVIVNGVQLQKVDPPEQVVDAFDDVQRSRADRERLKNEAESYANDVVPRARGEAQKALQQAEGYKQSVISRAEGDAQRFLSVYDAYKESKGVTEKRMYLETLQDLLKNSGRVIVGDSNAPVMPYLPLTKENAP
jgi:modulator of FtsH protease HflK